MVACPLPVMRPAGRKATDRVGGSQEHRAREAASLCGAPQSLRRASAVGERHRCSRKGSATARQIFLGHHSPKYFLTAGHLRCLAGLSPWRVSVDGAEGRDEGGEARRAPLPLGAWHGLCGLCGLCGCLPHGGSLILVISHMFFYILCGAVAGHEGMTSPRLEVI